MRMMFIANILVGLCGFSQLGLADFPRGELQNVVRMNSFQIGAKFEINPQKTYFFQGKGKQVDENRLDPTEPYCSLSGTSYNPGYGGLFGTPDTAANEIFTVAQGTIIDRDSINIRSGFDGRLDFSGDFAATESRRVRFNIRCEPGTSFDPDGKGLEKALNKAIGLFINPHVNSKGYLIIKHVHRPIFDSLIAAVPSQSEVKASAREADGNLEHETLDAPQVSSAQQFPAAVNTDTVVKKGEAPSVSTTPHENRNIQAGSARVAK